MSERDDDVSRESLDESLASLELTIQCHLGAVESLKIERDALQKQLDAALEALRAVPWLISALRLTAPATWSGWPIVRDVVRDVEKAIETLTPGERAGREGTA